MFADIGTLIWKEWRELFRQRGFKGALFNWVVLVAVMGIVTPLQMGKEWLSMPLVVAVWSWLPLISVMQVVSDTFAGERERHTLETLFASRLSDSAILFGKISVVVLFGWSIELAGLLLGMIVVNGMNWEGHLLVYSSPILFGVTPVVLLLVVLVAGIGTWVSLRSATVRSAYQKMMIAFMVMVFAPMLLIQIIPGVRDGLNTLVTSSPSLSTFGVFSAAILGWISSCCCCALVCSTGRN